MTTARDARDSAEVLESGTPAARTARESTEAVHVAPTVAREARESIEAVHVAPVVARTARESVEVLIDPMATFDVTGADTVAAPADVAVGSIVWASRSGEDGVPEPADGATHTSYLARTGSDAAGGTDAVIAVRTTYASAADTVPAPTDAATSLVRHLFVRFGVEHLDRPVDSVEHYTSVSEFRPSFDPPGRRLVRVRPNQAGIGPTATNWSSDVAVSKPRPYSADRPVLVDFGGFGFTTGGIAHNVTEDQVEEQFMPVFSPEEVDDGS